MLLSCVPCNYIVWTFSIILTAEKISVSFSVKRVCFLDNIMIFKQFAIRYHKVLFLSIYDIARLGTVKIASM